MSSFRPFIDPDTGGLDTHQIQAEAYPLAGLIALFAGLALVPFIFVVLAGGNSALSFLLSVISQFILAVGAGVVLMYVVARGVELGGA